MENALKAKPLEIKELETIRQGLKSDGYDVSISKLCQWSDMVGQVFGKDMWMPLADWQATDGFSGRCRRQSIPPVRPAIAESYRKPANKRVHT